MQTRKTSPDGIGFLYRQEGVVLKAYLCPAGRWTIGPGLTAASGVIAPKAGMTITAAQSAELTRLALTHNYEPTVNKTMPGANQYEFDGAISFHWNTGAIAKANWVKRWLARDWPGVERGLMAWTKGNGKVLPGLKRRRQAEFDVIHRGWYGIGPTKGSTAPQNAVFPLQMALYEREDTRLALIKLGYGAGDARGVVARSAAEAFQRDHDLTVDGIIGRATLSTLQRRIDAAAKATPAAAAAGATGGAAALPDGTSGITDQISQLPYVWPVLFAACAFWALYLGWRYRDVIAAKVQHVTPRAAAYLRSF